MSRLLAQFMMAGVVVISIDESSFKQEGLPRRYWQASSKTIKQVFSSVEVIKELAHKHSLEESKEPPRSPSPVKQLETSASAMQTPQKKVSIGLTPVNARLAALRLSSGVRSSPRLVKLSI